MDEKAQKDIEEFFEKNTKKLKVETVSDDLKAKFRVACKDLEDLKKEMEEKKTLFIEKSGKIKGKVESLKSRGIIKVDEAVTKKSEQDFEKYKQMLDHFVGEVDYELEFCKGIVSDTPPEFIRIAKGAVEDVDFQLNAKVTKLKKYVKTVRKDLRIGFSRYNFEFDEQMRRLEYLEAYVQKVQQIKGGGEPNK